MIEVSAPGRICLFGEHQDYLKLPVITAAINLRVAITGYPVAEPSMQISLPDIDSEEFLPLLENNREYEYNMERDYIKSVANLLTRQGIKLKSGVKCEVRGTIPINSGTSSSSALIVAWCKFLLEINKNINSQRIWESEQIARLAYLAEVEEFGEPGGMMDHYATAIGGILHQEFNNNVKITKLDFPLGTFVLGDSLQAKDTKKVLHRVKIGVLDAIKKITIHYPQFNLADADLSCVDQFRIFLTEAQQEVLHGALLNREITKQVIRSLQSANFDHNEFGKLLSEHQEILNKKLKISTEKINHMLNNAIKAGALGGKINGSGGGGCMFVYAPENPKKVAQSIESAGGKAYIITVDKGLQLTVK